MYYFVENTPYFRPPPPGCPPPCFLTNRMEHARFVLSNNMHPFEKMPYELPVTVLPPLPQTDKITLGEVNDIKNGMYKQYTALYWERELEKVQEERGYDAKKTIHGDLARYTRGFVHRNVYYRYAQYLAYHQPPLVSESEMRSIIKWMPKDILGFHPQKKYLSCMELSLRGLSRSLHLAREHAAFIGHLLHNFIDYLTVPGTAIDVVGTRSALYTFLEETGPQVRALTDRVFSFLSSQGEDVDKINVVLLCRHAFDKFVERLKYVNFVIKMHEHYDTYVVGILEDLQGFQDALQSVDEWLVPHSRDQHNNYSIQ